MPPYTHDVWHTSWMVCGNWCHKIETYPHRGKILQSVLSKDTWCPHHLLNLWHVQSFWWPVPLPTRSPHGVFCFMSIAVSNGLSESRFLLISAEAGVSLYWASIKSNLCWLWTTKCCQILPLVWQHSKQLSDSLCKVCAVETVAVATA